MLRARATGAPAVFWLDADRCHDVQINRKVKAYLPEHDASGLEVKIMKPVDAMKFSLERIRRGDDTISVTGNVLPDYLPDRFPILELGTSARILSIVPLLRGGGLFETGVGGSAPKHVQQLVKEGHLRWDSLGEYRALVASLEPMVAATGNPRPALLSKTLDEAIGQYLENARHPSHKVNEIDNRGSTFYVAPAWAKALTAQDEELKRRFIPVAAALAENEGKIAQAQLAAQGKPVDIGSYYFPDGAKYAASMRQRDVECNHRQDVVAMAHGGFVKHARPSVPGCTGKGLTGPMLAQSPRMDSRPNSRLSSEFDALVLFDRKSTKSVGFEGPQRGLGSSLKVPLLAEPAHGSSSKIEFRN